MKGNSKIVRIVFWSVFSISVLAFTGFFVLNFTPVQDEVEDIFYPKVMGRICLDDQKEEWIDVKFDKLTTVDEKKVSITTDLFSYSTPFVDHKLVCQAEGDTEHTVEIRVVNEDGEIVIDNVSMTRNDWISLENLEDNVSYKLQCKNGDGEYFFTVA